jgi:membrane-bound lytic murein transglycosylase A
MIGLIFLAGCATPPSAEQAAPGPAPVSPTVQMTTIAGTSAPSCPAVPEPPQCPELPPPSTDPLPPPEDPRAFLQPAPFDALPNLPEDDSLAALKAFRQGCTALFSQKAWRGVCATAETVGEDANRAAAFFREAFLPYQVISATTGSTEGMVTGYYEPLLRGSRKPTAKYRYPLYAPPQDLVTVDLTSLHPDLKHRRLRGRLEGNRLIPYFSREEIDGKQSPLRGLEIAWVDDAVESMFLQIQGSGQIEFENGERIRVGYADQNGHPFRGIGGVLVRRGELKLEQASMQGIKEWARRNPRKVQQYLNANPSYVFFRELAPDLPGPLGALGVPLTAERSVAIDPRVVPLGAPVYLSTTYPATNRPLQRLMMAQDTGGAIAGPARADFFWGFGDAAGQIAGRMKQRGQMWVLLPKGYDLTTLPPTVKLKP